MEQEILFKMERDVHALITTENQTRNTPGPPRPWLWEALGMLEAAEGVLTCLHDFENYMLFTVCPLAWPLLPGMESRLQ